MKRLSIDRILQSEEGGSTVYLQDGENRPLLPIGTTIAANEILQLMEYEEKSEDKLHDERMGRRDERIRDAVIEAIKKDKPLPKKPAGKSDIEELLDE